VPIFFSTINKPHRFDYLDLKYNISFMPNYISTIQKPDGVITCGNKKSELWQKLYFTINLCGLSPCSNLVSSLRLSENKLKIFNDFSKIASVNFNEAIVFDNQNINLDNKKGCSKYLTLDWISVHSGGRHNIDLIETNDKFVSQLWFYNSTRVPSKIKDACAISIIDDDDIDNFEFSDTYARFKSEKIMKDHGLRGASNGIDKKTGKKKYYSIKTSCSQREIIPLGASKIKETETIKTNKLTEEELLLNIKAGNDKIDNTVKKLCT
tara:strand:- start:1675 stop:2472 length:798 start_codon:yes stop_codon:yes gene_type:complete